MWAPKTSGTRSPPQGGVRAAQVHEVGLFATHGGPALARGAADATGAQHGG